MVMPNRSDTMLHDIEYAKHRNKKGWIGVDLDKTLAYYDHYRVEIGKPIPKMVNRVKKWLTQGKEVRIFTARVSPYKDRETDVEAVRERIKDWCLLHLGQKLEVTNVKDHKLIELWDDRAVGVVPNKGKRIGKKPKK